MGRAIFFMHGRNFKPPVDVLHQAWLRALTLGLQRSHPDKVPCLRETVTDMLYYGDISNDFLAGALHDKRLPVSARQLTEQYERALRELEADREGDLFREEHYRQLRDRPVWKARTVGAVSRVAEFSRTGGLIVGWLWPDIQEYWNARSRLAAEIMARMLPVEQALREGEKVLLISHSMGSVLCYDFLWGLSHGRGNSTAAADAKVDLWITLGSPLASEFFKRRTRGWRFRGRRRYPSCVRRWINISARDDHVCSDPTVADDFEEMLELGSIELIEDRLICNPARRDGKTHPHSAVGYLAHPVTCDVVADWL